MGLNEGQELLKLSGTTAGHDSVTAIVCSDARQRIVRFPAINAYGRG
jgi:hypothetical protein